MKREHCRSGLIRGYLAEQGRFERFTALKFTALALFLLAAWWGPAHLGTDSGEKKLQDMVRLAQKDMAAWRAGQGCAADSGADPWQLGLIGVEMSPVTTTLGSLRAKRTACNPAWSVVALRLFKSLGLKRGDRVAVLSSSSFPGMILNVLAAAENMGLKVFMVVSLGSSTWGANHPACPWPVLAGRLRSRGYLRTVADFYTLGGGGENGGGLSPEGLAVLERAAKESGVRLVRTAGLKEMVELKRRLIRELGCSLVINIGGGQAAMGTDEAVLKLGPGLVRPGPGVKGGNGVMGLALKDGLPVVHILNLKALCAMTGVPFDSPPSGRLTGGWQTWLHLLALAVFGLVLFRHRRWRLWPPPGDN